MSHDFSAMTGVIMTIVFGDKCHLLTNVFMRKVLMTKTANKAEAQNCQNLVKRFSWARQGSPGIKLIGSIKSSIH